MRVKKNVSNEYTTTSIKGFEIVDGKIEECEYQIDGKYSTTEKMLDKVRVNHPTFTSASVPTVSKVKKYVPTIVFNCIATDNENIADDSQDLVKYIHDSITSLQNLLNDVNTNSKDSAD